MKKEIQELLETIDSNPSAFRYFETPDFRTEDEASRFNFKILKANPDVKMFVRRVHPVEFGNLENELLRRESSPLLMLVLRFDSNRKDGFIIDEIAFNPVYGYH